MSARTIAIVAGLAGFLGTVPAWAHHSFAAEFDRAKVVNLEGTIVKMEWVNPHAWIHVAVKNPDGTSTVWMIEANTPNGLLRRGFTKQSLVEGTEVLVRGYQAKSGDNKANGSSMTFKDGRKLFLGSSSGDEEPETAKAPATKSGK
jgi:hypothetical protein